LEDLAIYGRDIKCYRRYAVYPPALAPIIRDAYDAYGRLFEAIEAHIKYAERADAIVAELKANYGHGAAGIEAARTLPSIEMGPSWAAVVASDHMEPSHTSTVEHTDAKSEGSPLAKDCDTKDDGPSPDDMEYSEYVDSPGSPSIVSAVIPSHKRKLDEFAAKSTGSPMRGPIDEAPTGAVTSTLWKHYDYETVEPRYRITHIVEHCQDIAVAWSHKAQWRIWFVLKDGKPSCPYNWQDATIDKSGCMLRWRPDTNTFEPVLVDGMFQFVVFRYTKDKLMVARGPRSRRGSRVYDR
jgi:hypothetical protein